MHIVNILRDICNKATPDYLILFNHTNAKIEILWNKSQFEILQDTHFDVKKQNDICFLDDLSHSQLAQNFTEKLANVMVNIGTEIVHCANTDSHLFFRYITQLKSLIFTPIKTKIRLIGTLFLGYEGTDFNQVHGGDVDKILESFAKEQQQLAKQYQKSITQGYTEATHGLTQQQMFEWYLHGGYTFANEKIVSADSGMMSNVFCKIEKYKDEKACILIQGETGTGKELIARALSVDDIEKDFFVVQNCAHLHGDPQIQLVELFGCIDNYVQNMKGRPGIFEVGKNGTVFLDEINSLSLEAQGMLLRFLENKEFCRMGSKKVIKANTRVVCASNNNLESEVRSGKFRNDLRYRLSRLIINIPPLRERTAKDCYLLAKYFLEKLNEEKQQKIELAIDACQYLQEDATPSLFLGNIRELQSVIYQSYLEVSKAKKFITKEILCSVMEKSSQPNGDTPIKNTNVGALFPEPWMNFNDLKNEFFKQAYEYSVVERKSVHQMSKMLGVHHNTLANHWRSLGLLSEK